MQQKEMDVGRVKKRIPLELHEQFVVHAWLAKHGIRHNHSPNGGKRHGREGAKLKRLGMSAGFPDFEIPYARKGYHGLYIELKRLSGGRLEVEQEEWRDFLLGEGFAWHLARGAQECIRIVCEYFDIKENI
jgi:hypothetical protein